MAVAKRVINKNAGTILKNVKVCSKSKLLPSPKCPSTIWIKFAKANIPAVVCGIHSGKGESPERPPDPGPNPGPGPDPGPGPGGTGKSDPPSDGPTIPKPIPPPGEGTATEPVKVLGMSMPLLIGLGILALVLFKGK
jgi:hypothetical protein